MLRGGSGFWPDAMNTTGIMGRVRGDLSRFLNGLVKLVSQEKLYPLDVAIIAWKRIMCDRGFFTGFESADFGVIHQSGQSLPGNFNFVKLGLNEGENFP